MRAKTSSSVAAYTTRASPTMAAQVPRSATADIAAQSGTGTMVKRLAMGLLGLGLGLSLGSCGPVAGFTADHWPHWAGGMPDGVPPRPGTPGYEDFVAHRQAEAEPAKPPAAPAATGAPAAPAPAAAEPDADQATQVRRGGLY